MILFSVWGGREQQNFTKGFHSDRKESDVKNIDIWGFNKRGKN